MRYNSHQYQIRSESTQLIHVIPATDINTPSPCPPPFQNDYYLKQNRETDLAGGYQLLKLFRLGL
jgi:hypothetical protein